MVGGRTGSKGRTESALLKRLLLNRFHIRLMLCCGGSLRFFFFLFASVVVVVAGMITGCVGGVLRDVLCNEIPLLFRSELYASVSIVTGGLYVAALALDLPHAASMFGAMAFGLAMRLLALRFNWHMPKFIYTQDLH